MASLVLDEQFESERLVVALGERGMDVRTVGEFGAQGHADPDVIRRVADGCAGPWVLVRMDVTILQDFAGFDWSRYAIAWSKSNGICEGGG